jgi:hypothetical protein
VYVFLCACLWVVSGVKGAYSPLTKAVALTAAITWLALFRFGHHSGWKIIFDWVPGGKAVRVLSRYEIFLTFPVVAVSMVYLQAAGSRMPKAILALIAILMIIEQTGAGPGAQNRADILARIAAPPPPSSCRSFFVTKAKGQDANSDLMKRFPHNVEAMLIAEEVHIPTINGYSTFLPPGWAFEDPTKPDYLDRVMAYARNYNVLGLCRLDLETLKWDGPLT